jgi:hypothetical protein
LRLPTATIAWRYLLDIAQLWVASMEAINKRDREAEAVPAPIFESTALPIIDVPAAEPVAEYAQIEAPEDDGPVEWQERRRLKGGTDPRRIRKAETKIEV